MNTRFALHAGLLALAMTWTGCGENRTAGPTAPTGPASLSPLFLPPLPAVDGLWGGPLTLESIAGGTGPARNAGLIEECVRDAFNGVIASGDVTSDHTLSITETDTGVVARLTSGGPAPSFLGTGLACTYSGRAGDTTLALDASTCDAPTLFLRCQLPDGEVTVRELQIAGSSITATFERPQGNPPAPQPAATVMSGRAAHTYHVFDVPAGDPLGSVVANHTFTGLTRR